MRLQRRFLERAGHTVTIVAPRDARTAGGRRRRRSSWRDASSDEAYVDTPSIPITLDREYSLSWPGRRTDRFVDAGARGRPPVDVVHVQADFWGAFIGHRFAAPARAAGRAHHAQSRRRRHRGDRALPRTRAAGAERAGSGGRCALAPSRRRTGATAGRTCAASPAVAMRSPRRRRTSRAASRSTAWSRRAEPCRDVDVMWNGIDDDVLDAALAAGRRRHARPGGPRFVWLGRMSPEKRLLPFLEALAESGIDADVEIIGGGGQERAARRLVETAARPAASVVFAGRLPYAETLRRIAAADAVVQTSIGFETQGMTVFEAASLGTPAVVSDPDIGAELGSGFWPVGDGLIPDASTAALAEALRPRPPTSRPARRADARSRRSASGSASRRGRRRWSRSTTASGVLTRRRVEPSCGDVARRVRGGGWGRSAPGGSRRCGVRRPTRRARQRTGLRRRITMNMAETLRLT